MYLDKTEGMESNAKRKEKKKWRINTGDNWKFMSQKGTLNFLGPQVSSISWLCHYHRVASSILSSNKVDSLPAQDHIPANRKWESEMAHSFLPRACRRSCKYHFLLYDSHLNLAATRLGMSSINWLAMVPIAKLLLPWKKKNRF